MVYQQAAADYAKQKGPTAGQAGPSGQAEPGPPPGEGKVVDSEDYKVK
jgi:hypothetical protein